MVVDEFEDALRVLNPSKVRSLELDFEFRPGAWRRCQEGLRQCENLAMLSVLKGTAAATELLLVCSRSLSAFHFEGGHSYILVHFDVPCMCSSIRHLSLARVLVSDDRGLFGLAPLESLTMVACEIRFASLPLTLGLKSLTAHDNTGFRQCHLLQVCRDLEHLDIRGDDLSLSADYLCELVSVATKLRFLTATFSNDRGNLESALKKIRPTLECIHLC